MAWNTPANWTDGEIVPASKMNAQVRDNMNALSTHGHTGAAGDGAQALGPLDTVDFDDQATPPASAGRLLRDGNDLYWHDGSEVVKITNHTHGIASNSANLSESSPALSGGTVACESQGTFTDTETTIRTTSPTFTGTPPGRIVSGYIAAGRESSSAQNVTLRLYINAVQVASSTKSYPGLDASVAGIPGHIVHHVESNPTSGHELKLTVQSAGSTFHRFAAGISNRTVNVA